MINPTQSAFTGMLAVTCAMGLGAAARAQQNPGAGSPPSARFGSVEWCGPAHLIMSAFVGTHAGIFVSKPDGSDVHRLTSPDSNFAWGSCSPDGRRVAYMSFSRPPGAKLPENRVFVANIDGTGAHQLFSDTLSRSAPAWSPDGRSFSYTRRDNSERHVFVSDPGGVHERQLTRGPVVNQSPRWLRDGTGLVYFSMRPPSTIDSVYIVNVATGKEVSTRVSGVYPGGGAGREMLIFDAPDSVLTARADGGGRTLLLENAFYGSLSPDASKIVAIAKVDSVASAIVMARADGSNPKRIISGKMFP